MELGFSAQFKELCLDFLLLNDNIVHNIQVTALFNNRTVKLLQIIERINNYFVLKNVSKIWTYKMSY